VARVMAVMDREEAAGGSSGKDISSRMLTATDWVGAPQSDEPAPLVPRLARAMAGRRHGLEQRFRISNIPAQYAPVVDRGGAATSSACSELGASAAQFPARSCWCRAAAFINAIVGHQRARLVPVVVHLYAAAARRLAVNVLVVWLVTAGGPRAVIAVLRTRSTRQAVGDFLVLVASSRICSRAGRTASSSRGSGLDTTAYLRDGVFIVCDGAQADSRDAHPAAFPRAHGMAKRSRVPRVRAAPRSDSSDSSRRANACSRDRTTISSVQRRRTKSPHSPKTGGGGRAARHHGNREQTSQRLPATWSSGGSPTAARGESAKPRISGIAAVWAELMQVDASRSSARRSGDGNASARQRDAARRGRGSRATASTVAGCPGCRNGSRLRQTIARIARQTHLLALNRQ